MSATRSLAPERDIADLDGLEDRVGFALRLAQLAVFQDLIAVLRPLGLRVTEFSVLVVVGKTPGLKQQAVGAALQIQPPNLNAIMDRLLQQGLINREPAPADRRSYALYLTGEGEALLAQAKLAHDQHDQKVQTLLRGLDIATVLEALRRLATL